MSPTAEATAWVQAVDIPEHPTETDIRAFFGVPPDPQYALDKNIRRKRRAWRTKLRERKASEEAERKVNFALKLIDELERRLKRGVADEEFDLEALRDAFREAPQNRVGELDDLWRVLEDLLAAGDLEEALRVAHEARERFEGAAQAQAAFAWLAAVASRTNPDTSASLRTEGLLCAQAAIEGGMKTADAYSWAAILQLDLQTWAEALTTLTAAESQLKELTPWLRSHRCEAHAGLGDVEQAAQDAKAAVDGAGDDSALRSNTAGALVAAARTALLPIADADMLRRYTDLMMLAAWCADGVPEAEDHVRPYRLWGVQAASRAYVGRIELRSILAVVSGFLFLPVLNRSRSKPVWKVFLDGPASYGEMGEIVAMSPIARHVHEGIAHKLSWTS